jgi:hypothetical protein
MRRLALISGILLTLTAGVWSSALAAVASESSCLHEASAPDAAAVSPSDEHDCCRAKLGEADAPRAEPAQHSHDAATHEQTLSQPQADTAHAPMDCAGVEQTEHESKATAFGERERSCFECCAGRANQTPATATLSAPEQNKAKRAAAQASVKARDSFAPEAHGVSHLAPSQHAPPTPRERRHMLISVFLI